MFKGRRLLIASKHQKEKAANTLLETALGVKCSVAAVDTDSLGTFTGEVERTLNPLDAAIKKCEMAIATLGGDLAFANEGSFGPHPQIPFTACDEELVVLVDKLNGLEIAERHISLNTNFRQSYIQSVEELQGFAELVGFPHHGIILRNSPGSSEKILKGISTWTQLNQGYKIYSKSIRKFMPKPICVPCTTPPECR
jgi:hypothetical protein